MTKLSNKNEQPLVEFFDPKGNIENKFDFYIKIVIGIFVVTTLLMIVVVGTLIVDSFHFNSATYTEYSKKIGTQNSLLKNNELLLEKNQLLFEENKQNQELIIKNQKIIEDLINEFKRSN